MKKSKSGLVHKLLMAALFVPITPIVLIVHELKRQKTPIAHSDPGPANVNVRGTYGRR